MDRDPQETSNTMTQPSVTHSSGVHSTIVWPGILVAYCLLFSITGYIAFFQEPFNPAANPSAEVIALLVEKPAVGSHVLEALKDESAAFKARKDLAAQSFNVVLGALLGFLSASAVRASSSAKRET